MRNCYRNLGLAILVLALPLTAAAQVDIEIVSFTAPLVADPGEPIGSLIHLEIRNSGPDDIDDGFSVGFYISMDEVITTADQLLIGGREFVVSLGAGAQVTVPLFSGARIPDGYPLGSAFLGVIVDEFNVIPETDETNNTAASMCAVGGGVPVEARSWDSVKRLFR